jgi:glycosyltransferase involved in cell wall biosynthesis
MTESRRSTAERRVLVVVRYPLGGIRTYILYNYPTLLRAGYRFTFVGPADDTFRTFRKDLESWDGVEFVEAAVACCKCKLRSTIRPLLRKGRFALMHSQGFTAGVQSVLANFGLRVPHAMTVHGVIPPTQYPGLRGAVSRYVIGALLARIDAIVAPSEDARENILHYFRPLRRRRNRIVTIPHGVDVSRFSSPVPAETECLRNRLGLDRDTLLIGFFGRFMPEKGFLILMEAVDRLLADGAPRPLHLVAVGSGDYIREYKAEFARRPRLHGRISFLDHTPNIAPILQQVDLVVMPSLWEACGLLPMEAMCAGIPVLGSDCIGLREVLRGTPSRMVPKGKPAAMAGALRIAMVSPWKDDAREYAPIARARFDVNQSVVGLKAVFDRLVRRGFNRLPQRGPL